MWVAALALALAACSSDDADTAVPVEAETASIVDAPDDAATDDDATGSGDDATSDDATSDDAASGVEVTGSASPEAVDDASTSAIGTIVDGNVETVDVVGADADPTEPLTTGVPNAINVTVPPAPERTAQPVDISEPAESAGVRVSVLEQQAIEVTTRLPGEIGGPAVLLTLEFVNGTADAIDLGIVTVDLVLAGGVSANPVTTEPADPFSGVVAPGESQTADYVFSVAPDLRDDVDLTIRYSAAEPTLVFTGSLIDA